MSNPQKTRTFSIASLSETQALAQKLAGLIRPPLALALDGTLGAGKTQFVRYFAAAAGVPSEQVTSPTYVLLQRYQGAESLIYHFDFYRLETEGQVWDLGIDELYEQPVVILIEWANKFPVCLPDEDYLQLEFENSGEDRRTVTLSARGSKSLALLERLDQLSDNHDGVDAEHAE